MPMYDRICKKCDVQLLDCWEPVNIEPVNCKTCNFPTERIFLSKPSNVIQDSIEGGIWIKHGICNDDGTPRKYYSKSEMAAEAARRGLTNKVRHAGTQGSDKSEFTTCWVGTPTISEEERIAHWWETEQREERKFNPV